jgi:uncharacterized protein involved in propanediol utilization
MNATSSVLDAERALEPAAFAPRIRPPLSGVGRCPGHHGELLQGAFEEPDGVHRALLTLPLRALGSHAEARLRPGDDEVTVSPDWKTRSRRAAELTLRFLGVRGGAAIRVESTIPPSIGLGSSTSDVTATIRACAAAAGARLSDRAVAQLAVSAEIASDAIMFSGAVLFAQREGLVLETFSVDLPAMDVLGFSTAPLGRATVDTLEHPPAQYTTWEIEAFRALRGLARRAVRRRSTVELARVATASARLNQRHLPLERFEDLVAVAGHVGADGVQVAHSGAVAGFLFSPAAATPARVDAARERLGELGIDAVWLLPVGEDRGVAGGDDAD